MPTWKVTGSGTLIIDGEKSGDIHFELFRRENDVRQTTWSGTGILDRSTILKAQRGTNIIIETASAAFTLKVRGVDLDKFYILFDIIPFSGSALT